MSRGNHIFCGMLKGHEVIQIWEHLKSFYDIKLQDFSCDTNTVPALETLTPCAFDLLIAGSQKYTKADYIWRD